MGSKSPALLRTTLPKTAGPRSAIVIHFGMRNGIEPALIGHVWDSI